MTHRRSLAQLQNESEMARARLAATVSELRSEIGDTAAEVKHVANPSYIKTEVGSFIAQERKKITESLQDRIWQNPLQAAAIGAAIAYPTLGLLRAIPAPLLMIGAGLFLTSSRGQHATVKARAKIDDLLAQGTKNVSDLAQSAQTGVVDPINQTFTEARDALTGSASRVADQIRRGMDDAQDAVAAATRGASHNASEMAEQVAGAAKQTFANANESVAGVTQRSKNSLMDFANDNPLLVAGIGLGIGMFIAAAFPASDAENNVLGKVSDDVKDKARSMAAEGLDKAKNVAGNIMADAAAAASEQALQGAGVRKTVGHTTRGIEPVLERGGESALNVARAPNIQPS